MKEELTLTRVNIQPTCSRHRLWTTTIGVQRIKSDEVPALPFLKRDLKNLTYKSLLLVSYAWMNTA